MQRNNTVDYMRVLGILLIIFAHVTPPSFVFQLRTFDVPMMTFISGMAFYCAGKYKVDFLPYAISRFKRLIFPVWAFQVIFFSLVFIFKPDPLYQLITFQTISSSIALNGFGFFWVIKIFILISVLSPVYFIISEKLSGIKIPLTILSALLISSALSNIHMSGQSIIDKSVNHFFSEVVIPAFSYGSMFLLGVKWLTMSNREKNTVFMVFFVTSLLFALYNKLHAGSFPHPQDYKYPATFFFISYSIPMTYLSYRILNKISEKFGDLPMILRFVSSNTIWIYLWHIPVVTYFYMTNTNINYMEKYILAFSCGTLMTAIQYLIVKKITLLLKDHKNAAKLIRNTFTG